MVALDLNPPIKHAGLVPVRLGKLVNKTLTTDTGSGNTVGAQRLNKKKELLQLVDLDKKSPHKKHAGLVPVMSPVRLGKLNNTLING